MERDANYFLVGISVSAALLGLVIFTIWLAGEHPVGHYDRYTIYFTDPVSGLDKDSIVKYRGIDVGKILDLRLSPGRGDLIKADIEVKGDTPVRAKTSVQIHSQGITGLSYVDLSTDDLAGPPPPAVPDEKYPVLHGTGSSWEKLMDTLPKVATEVEGAASSIRDLSRSGTKMTDSIRALADKLTENPSQILSSPQRKGVEIPK